MMMDDDDDDDENNKDDEGENDDGIGVEGWGENNDDDGLRYVTLRCFSDSRSAGPVNQPTECPQN